MCCIQEHGNYLFAYLPIYIRFLNFGFVFDCLLMCLHLVIKSRMMLLKKFKAPPKHSTFIL